MSVASVPSLSLPGSVDQSVASVPGSDAPLRVNETPATNTKDPRALTTDGEIVTDGDDDLYSVPSSDTADYVGIGSLAHIIRKCFKEIYYPEIPGNESNVAGTSTESTKSGSQGSTFAEATPEELANMDEEQLRIYNEEKAAFEALQEKQSDANEQENDESNDSEEKETPETARTDDENTDDNTNTETAEETKEVGDETTIEVSTENEDASSTPFNIEVPEEPPILPLPIAFEAKEQGLREKERIDQGLRERVAQARELLLHLDHARKAALEADERDRVELLEEHGLLLKAELPRGPSHLDLDPKHLSGQWPQFGSNLILASELFREIDAKQQARTGTLSPEAMERAMKTADVPHYMQLTGSMDIRRGIMAEIRDKRPKQREAFEEKKKRLLAITAAREAENDPALAAAKHPPPREAQLKMGKKKPVMRSDDREINEKILDRMKSKLDFTRNPRFDMQRFGGKAGGGANGLGNTMADLTTAYTQPPTVESDMAFKVVPEKVQFTDYEIGGQYETTVYFHNVTPVMRRLRLLPPRTKFFALSMVEFPAEDGGLVAPGMSVKVTVRFMPDSLADYQDALLCTSETNRFKVTVEAFRPPPTLSIPLVLDCGCCLIGAKETVTFKCTNYGGAGRFRLLPDDQWPHPSGDASDPSQPMRLAPFLIEPAEFELLPNETLEIKVHHFPKVDEEVTRKFVMVCDNCQVKTFTARGTGCRVSISVNGMAGLSVDATVPNAVVPREVIFDPVTPGATAVQDLSILNLTPLKLAYRWEISDSKQLTLGNGGDKIEDVNDGKSRLEPSSIFEISPANGLLALNGTTHFEVSFAPEAAAIFPGVARLVIEGVPPLAVDNVDSGVSTAALAGSVQGALKEVFKGKKKRKRRKRGVPEAVKPEEPEVEDPFTMDIVLNDIACLALDVHGAGKQSEFDISPRVSMLPGPILPDMPTTFTLTVKNLSDAEVGYEWAPGRYRTNECEGYPYTLRYSPPNGRLQPLEVVVITVEFTAHCIGTFDIDLPCMVESGPLDGICGRMAVEVCGPIINILEPEIDFGLIGVGECSELLLHLHNVSAVEAKWNFAEIETEQVHQALAAIAERQNNEEMGGSSSRASSLNGRSLTQGINKNNLCRVLFNPISGVLGPGMKTPVTVMCFSGRLPQRLRHPLECIVDHGKSTFCRSRAEVQAPKVYLEESVVDLKNTYIGVSVETTIHVKNLSNLPAEFSFSRVIDPDNESVHSIFDIQFSPNEGVLTEKEYLTVKIKYTALKAGRVDCMFALDVAGMEFPLGFQLNTISKGLLVTYTLRDSTPDQLLPCVPLGQGWKDTEPPSEGGKEPNARIVPALDFGDDCPLQKRRRLQLVIRNYSAIPTSFSLEMKSYPGAPNDDEEDEYGTRGGSKPKATITFEPSAPATRGSMGSELPPNTSGDMRSSTAGTGRRRSRAASRNSTSSKRSFLLGNKHEKTQQYRSKNGRAYTEDKTQQQIDQSTLRMGRGAAFIITPSVGALPPWGSVTVDVVSCNDMPGAYRDELISKVNGLPPASLRVKMKVIGTPLSLSNTCVGLDQSKSPPIFAWGNLLRSATETSRYLKVVNSGPIPCQLNWTMKGIYEEPPLLDIGLDPTGDEEMPVNLVLTHHPPNPPPPFTVYPQDAIIPAYGVTSFEVTFVPPDECDSFKAIMHADASYDFSQSGTSRVGDSTTSGGVSATSSVESTNDPETKSLDGVGSSSKVTNDGAGPDLPGCLTVACSATTIVPNLTVHKAMRVDTANFNFDEVNQFVKFKAWSTHGNNNPSHFRTLNMNNLCGTPLTFTVSAAPVTVFQVVNVKSSAPKHPLQDKGASMTGLGKKLSAQSSTSGPFTLPADNSIAMTLKFKPKAHNGLNGTLSGEPGALPLEKTYDGKLKITFSNGVEDEQIFKLHAHVLRPVILVAPAQHRYGAVHVERWQSSTFYLSNPSEVDAEWRIQHIPYVRPPKRVGTSPPKASMMPEDDPSVFKFSKVAGVLTGPSMPLEFAPARLAEGLPDASKAPFALDVTFKPADAAYYRCRFRFVVTKGQSFDVVLYGKGTFNEGADRVFEK